MLIDVTNLIIRLYCSLLFISSSFCAFQILLPLSASAYHSQRPEARNNNCQAGYPSQSRIKPDILNFLWRVKTFYSITFLQKQLNSNFG